MSNEQSSPFFGRFFGPPLVYHGRLQLTISRKSVLALLSYLSTQGEGLSREHLQSFLWPDEPVTKRRAELRRTFSVIRNRLGRELLQDHNGQIFLEQGGALFCDVSEFQEALTQLNSGNLRSAAERFVLLRQAKGLYKGDFLEGFTMDASSAFMRWVESQRDQFRRDYIRVLAELVKTAESLSYFEEAQEYAEQWMEASPLCEEAYRRSMELCVWLGNRQAALKKYVQCSHQLQDHLGIVPSEETSALYKAIKLNLYHAPKEPPLHPHYSTPRRQLVIGIKLLGLNNSLEQTRVNDTASLLNLLVHNSIVKLLNRYRPHKMQAIGSLIVSAFHIGAFTSAGVQELLSAATEVKRKGRELGTELMVVATTGVLYTAKHTLVGPAIEHTLAIIDFAQTNEIVVDESVFKAAQGKYRFQKLPQAMPWMAGMESLYSVAG